MIYVLLPVAFVSMTPGSYTVTTRAYLHMGVDRNPGLNTQLHYNATRSAGLKADAIIPVLTSGIVAQRIIEPLKLDITPEELAFSMSATWMSKAMSVQVSMEASASRQTQALAGEVVHQTAEEVTEPGGSNSPVKVSPLSSAELVSATRSLALATCVGVGLLAGLVLGYVWVLIQELLDKNFKGSEDVHKALSAPMLGVLPGDPSPLRLRYGMQTEIKERPRATHISILHALSHGTRQVVVVTSADPRKGTSTTAAGLAWVLALSGHRVVLVRGDLRSPSAVGAPSTLGLAGIPVGATHLSQVLIKDEVPGLELLPAGDISGNSSELLGGHNMSDLLHHLAVDRIVIINAPPVCRFIDAAMLIEYVDGVLFMTRARRTSAEKLHEATLAVRQGSGHILGVVFTSVSDPRRGGRNVQAGVTHAESATV